MSARAARVEKAVPSKTAQSKSGQSKSDQSKSKGDDRPKLRLVDKKALVGRTRRRAVLISSLALLVVGMFMTALAHARLVEGQRELDTIRADIADLEGQRATLEADIVISSSPEAIVFRARSLGMVRASDPQYLVAIRRSPGS